MKETNEYKKFQQQCLRKELNNRYIDSLKHERQLKSLIDNLSTTMNVYDFSQLQKYLFERAKQVTEKTQHTKSWTSRPQLSIF